MDLPAALDGPHQRSPFRNALIERACDSIRVTARLDYRRKDGTTERDILLGVTALGAKAPRIDEPELPTELRRLLEVFWDLSLSREHGAMGEPRMLTHQEIRAWQLNMRVHLRPWEVTAIRAFDTALLAGTAEGREADSA